MEKKLILGALTVSLSISAFASPNNIANITIIRPGENVQNNSTSLRKESTEISKGVLPEANNRLKNDEATEDPNEASSIADEKLKQAQEQARMIAQNVETESSPPNKQTKKIKFEQVKYDVFTTDIGIWNKTTLEQLEKQGQENLEKSYKAFLDKK